MRKTNLSVGKVRIGGKTFWQVTIPKLGGGRIRRTFKDRPDAQTFLEQQKVQLSNFGTAGANMDERLRGDALAAFDVLQPWGASLLDAARFYAAHLKATSGGIALREAVARLLKDRERPTYSPRYRKSLQHRLYAFAESLPAETTTRQVTLETIQGFLDQLFELQKSAGTVESYRKDIFTLFSFCEQREWVEANPAKRIRRGKLEYAVEILKPAQCSALLYACDDAILPSVAIGMFCGLRQSEIERLDWSKVDLTENRIRIDASTARKVQARRVVPIPEACASWLRPLARPTGPVHPEGFRTRFDHARVRAGFVPSFAGRKDETLTQLLFEAKRKKVKLTTWPANCLRHSALSYALADSGDEGRVATWAGNSPAMLKRHYDAQASKREAKAFFDIYAPTPAASKVSQFKAA